MTKVDAQQVLIIVGLVTFVAATGIWLVVTIHEDFKECEPQRTEVINERAVKCGAYCHPRAASFSVECPSLSEKCSCVGGET